MSDVNTLGVPLPLYNFAAALHESWRSGLSDVEKADPKVETIQGAECATNVAWEELHIMAKLKKLDDVVDAYNALISESDTQSCLNFIHNLWMRRNPVSSENANLHVPYEQLPESVKESYNSILSIVSKIKEELLCGS